jgi:hypothetical protein
MRLGITRWGAAYRITRPRLSDAFFAINTAAFAAHFLAHRLGVFAGLAKEPRLPALERST